MNVSAKDRWTCQKEWGKEAKSKKSKNTKRHKPFFFHVYCVGCHQKVWPRCRVVPLHLSLRMIHSRKYLTEVSICLGFSWFHVVRWQTRFVKTPFLLNYWTLADSGKGRVIIFNNNLWLHRLRCLVSSMATQMAPVKLNESWSKRKRPRSGRRACEKKVVGWFVCDGDNCGRDECIQSVLYTSSESTFSRNKNNPVDHHCSAQENWGIDTKHLAVLK